MTTSPHAVQRTSSPNAQRRLLLQCFPATLAGLSLTACGGSSSLLPDATPPTIAFLNAFMTRHAIPGATFALAYKGELVVRTGLGLADVEKSTRVSTSTQFRIASVSKPLTAVAVFHALEARGADLQAALNRPVFGGSGYLPQFSGILDPRVLKITLRDLLQHTGGWDSGLGYDPQYDLPAIAKSLNVQSPPSASDIISYMLQNKPLDVAPGTVWHYSNFGYNILARVVEALSGQPYEVYFRRMVLPLGIHNMWIAGNQLKDRRPDETIYYDDPRAELAPSIFDGGVSKGPMSYSGLDLRSMDGHGGWLATATDLVKIASAVTPADGGLQLLKPASIAVMTAPVSGINNPQVSLGWVSEEGGRKIGHAGALTTGTLSYLLRRADGIVYAVIFNRLPAINLPDIGLLGKELTTGMAKALDDVKSWPAGVRLTSVV